MLTANRPGSSAEETRARILAAAKEVYEQNGTRGTTTRVVAERAGVNEATLFRHFGSKHALLEAMRESACPATFVESVLAALSGDLRTDLRALAGILVERMHAQRSMMCISMAEDARAESMQPDGPRSEPEWRGPMHLRTRLDEFFAQHIATGAIRGNSHRLATFFLGMCFSYVVARKIWDSTIVRSEDLDFLVDLFLNGVQ